MAVLSNIMFYGDVFQRLLLLLGYAQLCHLTFSAQFKNDSACYGTFNGFLNLLCGPGEYVRVSTTMYGVKPTSEDCKRFATKRHPQPECCQPGPNDCVIYPPPGGPPKCHLGPSCNMVADWVSTFTDCDQSIYPLSTNYMSVFYTCEKDTKEFVVSTDNPKKPTEQIPIMTDALAPDNSHVDSTSLATVTTEESRVGESRVEKENTEPSGGNTTFSMILSNEGRHSSDVELSDSMLAAVIGGSIGMCLTLILFIFYWGRKKRLRIVSSKQPTVWDYLLTNTFTVRGYNGYDHFSSRSSVCSDSDVGSPVVRKNMWLPNIVQQHSEEKPDDIISNYDNTKYKVPKVEVHPNATPSPYAILNLETLSNYIHRDNHEA